MPTRAPSISMKADNRPLAIALMGPTASGKSAWAMALAKALDGEIISIDSALVYRHLDIGAAKPDPREQAEVPHHMLDIREPWQTYSAAEFARDARHAIENTLARGRIPILAGGTGLYFQALLHGLASMPEADPVIRAQLAADAAQHGWAALHARLAQVDPQAASRIHPTDPQRIQRALEVWQLTGRPLSQWQQDAPPGCRFPARVLKLILAPQQRARLHQRIEQRFDAMLAAGFLDEVRTLRALPELAGHPAPLDLPALRAVGYRQAWHYLEGHGDMADFRAAAIAATRQLAKRQLTWLRARHDALWLDPLEDEQRLLGHIEQFIGTAAQKLPPCAR